MKIINIQNVSEAKTPHKALVKKLFAFEHATVVHITLQPKDYLRPHITPVDALFYVLEGNGTVEIGEEVRNVMTNDLIISPAKIKHRLFNESDSIFSFLVIKVPTPTTETKTL